jgi:Xaa-Pro aminopeptidase
VRVITEGLVELGFLEGSIAELVETQAYRPWFMHKTGHWLGLDVHDVGEYKKGQKWRSLEVGMTLTVEPGLYVSENDVTVPKAFRGIGIRIEDDVLIREEGPLVLTAGVVKERADIEALMAQGG